MIDKEKWQTINATVRVRHIQKEGEIGVLMQAINEIILELADPTIEEVEIHIKWDRINLATIDVTVSR